MTRKPPPPAPRWQRTILQGLWPLLVTLTPGLVVILLWRITVNEHARTRRLIMDAVTQETAYIRDAARAGASLPQLVDAVHKLSGELADLRLRSAEAAAAQHDTTVAVKNLQRTVSTLAGGQQALRVRQKAVEKEVAPLIVPTTTTTTTLPDLPWWKMLPGIR